MKGYSLLLLSSLFLLGCNPNKEVINTLTRDEVKRSLLAEKTPEVNITNINANWNNASENPKVQETLQELGATGAFTGENNITDKNKISSIRDNKYTNHSLYQDNFDTYFPITTDREYIYTINETKFELYIEFSSEDLCGKYTYVSYNGIIKSFSLNSKVSNYSIADTFTFSYFNI